MAKEKLRLKINKMVSEEISKDPSLTKEGIIDRILDRVGRAQKRASDKNFEKGLESIAKRSPGGKAKVAKFIADAEHFEKVTADAEDLIAKFGL